MVEFRLRDGTGSIRLRYLVEDTDRHGNVRLYVRRPGQPKIRLHEQPGTDAFMAEYRAAIGGAPANAKRQKPKAKDPASLRWLCQQWYQDADFRTLSRSTQHIRRLVLDALCDQRDSQGRCLGDKPFALMEARHIRAIRDTKADTPAAANNLVGYLRLLFKWAVNTERATRNPARDVPKLTLPNPDGHHTWTPPEIAQFEAHHPIGTHARLAMAVLYYTGLRRSDAVLLGRQHISNGWIRITLTKNRARKPTTIEIPLLPELAAIIDATPTTQGNLTLLTTSFGQPYGAVGFGNRFREWCNEAGLPHCSAHGLRKSRSTALAESGATERELMAWNGWHSAGEATRYTRKANQRTLAGRAAEKLMEQKMDKTVPPNLTRKSGGDK
ncbi:site-specific integrase [Niveispirillum sp.]|uniref:tyrosine-type recombinase/integrase n=1 Tax=Niveispirillum sp. TaxID=1917217 RepID=UPI001B541003|nr:site-specific integrase [Niveispirillum sp.]MBP7337669.1 site-specific integrase [Niveispirillum sp.]